MSAGAWAGAVDGFAAHLRAAGTVKQVTQTGYAQHVRRLADGVTAGPWDLTTGELSSWIEAQNWSIETRRKVVVSLRQFYAWAVAERHIEWAPTAGIARAARRRPGPRAEDLAPPWSGPVADYVATLRAGSRSERTIEQYLVRLRGLSRVAADPWTVTTQQLAQWLSNPDWAPATKRCARVAVGSFYRWAVTHGRIDVSPTMGLDTIRVPRSLPRPAPEAALRAALAASDDRTRMALMLAAYAGLRMAEITGLHLSQINDAHLLVVGKGGHHRIVPIDPRGDLSLELRAELGRRRDGRRGTGYSGDYISAHGYLFPSTEHAGPMTPNALGRIISQALPEHWTAHTLRHRFATNAYRTDRDLMAVQQLLGHARPETTAVYAQVPEGALLSAVIGAGPEPRGMIRHAPGS